MILAKEGYFEVREAWKVESTIYRPLCDSRQGG